MIPQKNVKKAKKTIILRLPADFVDDFDKACEGRSRTIVIKKLMSLFIRGKIRDINWNEK